MSETIELVHQIEEVLKTVYDPEIPVNIVELGLVYNIDITADAFVNITMTLTAPGCPVAGEIIMEVDNKVRDIDGVRDVNVMLTFDPPWDKERMSEEAKLELGFL